METLSQDSSLECQICFNYFSPRRRPKLLDCRHTCCSVCLTQMRGAQREIRCPWCRAVTRLPAGCPVSQLPDDPEAVAVVTAPHASEHAPVFIRLPSSGCYMLPLPLAEGAEPGCRFAAAAAAHKGLAVLTLPLEQRQQLQQQIQQQQQQQFEDAVLDVGEPGRRGAGPGAGAKGSTWSGVCTVILVACVLLFLLGIVLHNMSCISKRFTVISCG